MKIAVEPGKYVVAVSGGVDSMALLDMLLRAPGVELAVAHFDHGIRADSALDRKLVQRVANAHNVPFFYETAALGPHASEATARTARYKFLHSIREEVGAQAIVTAHHQDDMLETAILNLLRGTGRLGLSSLRSHSDLLRPLLHASKQDILAYAQTHHLEWREDSTNQNEQYLRNYIRRALLPTWSERQRAQLLGHIAHAARVNEEIDALLANALHAQASDDQLDRAWFIALPYAVSTEMLAAWLRRHDVRDFDQKRIHQLAVAAKTLVPGKQRDVSAHYILRITKDMLCLTPRPLRKNSGSHV